jgi:hypothetical protein
VAASPGTASTHVTWLTAVTAAAGGRRRITGAARAANDDCGVGRVALFVAVTILGLYHLRGGTTTTSTDAARSISGKHKLQRAEKFGSMVDARTAAVAVLRTVLRRIPLLARLVVIIASTPPVPLGIPWTAPSCAVARGASDDESPGAAVAASSVRARPRGARLAARLTVVHRGRAAGGAR